MLKFAVEDVWIESMRPQSLDDIIGNKPIIDLLKTISRKDKSSIIYSAENLE